MDGERVVKKFLVIDPEKCTGCRICELVCSFHHTKEFNPKRARIAVLRNEETGINIPMVCQQCEVPLCQEACPTGATHRDEKTGALLIDEEKCIGCRMCIYACPFGGPSIDPLTMMTIKCDLCGGEPRCVEYCPRRAVEYLKADKVGIMRKKTGAGKVSKMITIALGV